MRFADNVLKLSHVPHQNIIASIAINIHFSANNVESNTEISIEPSAVTLLKSIHSNPSTANPIEPTLDTIQPIPSLQPSIQSIKSLEAPVKQPHTNKTTELRKESVAKAAKDKKAADKKAKKGWGFRKK